MKEKLSEIIEEMTADDAAQLKGYKADLIEIAEDIEFHEKKLKSLKAAQKLKEEFVKRLEAKLSKVDKLEGRILDTVEKGA